MNNNIPYIIETIKNTRGDDPGKKELQKIVFLIEEKGVDLNFEYGLHFYGPYSAELDAATFDLSAEGIIEFHKRGYSHKMKLREGLEIKPDLNKDDQEVIVNLIRTFKDKSPSQLELLTTTIYAYNNLKDKSKESVINGVKKIKGNKYSNQEIEQSIDEMRYFGKVIV